MARGRQLVRSIGDIGMAIKAPSIARHISFSDLLNEECKEKRVFVKVGWNGGQSSPASIMRMSVEMSAP